jgi:hypothetical protein
MNFYRTERGKRAQTPPPCLALHSPAAKTTAKLFPTSIQKGAVVFRLPVLLRLILGLENTLTVGWSNEHVGADVLVWVGERSSPAPHGRL